MTATEPDGIAGCERGARGPDRVLAYPAAGFDLWPTVAVRSAGFPVEMWTRLTGADQAVRSADEAIDAATADDELARTVDDCWDAFASQLQSGHFDALACALLWQNPSAYLNSWRPIQDGELRGGSARLRYKLRNLIAYVQRYLFKADSIGYFGPVAWAGVTESDARIEFEHGESVSSGGVPGLENWALRELADAATNAQELRERLRPRVVPHARLEGRRLLLPFGAGVDLEEASARVLSHCDGQRTARAIIDCFDGDIDGVPVSHVLEDLGRRGWVVWRYPVAQGRESAARYRRFLEEAPPSAARRQALADLDRVGTLVTGLPAAPGRPRELASGLDAVRSAFEAATGRAAYRDRASFARSLVSFDARRNVDVRIGRELLAEVQEALAIVVRSATWVLDRVADVYRRRLRETFDELASESGGAVELTDLWLACGDLWFAPDTDLLDSVVADLQSRWARLLGSDLDGSEPVRLRAADIATAVNEAFGHGRAGAVVWPYICPDLLVSTGEQKYVLGELHLAINSLNTAGFCATHPDPDALAKLWQEDHRGRRRVTIRPNPEAIPGRLLPALGMEHEVEVATSPGQVAGSASSLRDFIVTDAPGARDSLEVVARGSGERWELLDFLADPLGATAVNTFRPIAAANHQPRVVIDDLVVSRQTWWLSQGEVDELIAGSQAQRLLAARALARRRQLPRYIFLKVGNRKPMFVDLERAASIQAGARLLASETAGTRVRCTEMLPTPEQLWLTDEEQQHYVSEFRLVVHRSAP